MSIIRSDQIRSHDQEIILGGVMMSSMGRGIVMSCSSVQILEWKSTTWPSAAWEASARAHDNDSATTTTMTTVMMRTTFMVEVLEIILVGVVGSSMGGGVVMSCSSVEVLEE